MLAKPCHNVYCFLFVAFSLLYVWEPLHAKTGSCNELNGLTITSGGSAELDLSHYRADGATPGGYGGGFNSCILESRDGAFLNPDENESVFFGGIPASSTTCYNKGISDGGGDTTGGFFCHFDRVRKVWVLLIQAGKDFYTPGNLMLKIKNIGDTPIKDLRLNFLRYLRSDQEQSVDFRVSYVVGNYLVNDDQYNELHTDQKGSAPMVSAGFISWCESSPVENINLQPDQDIYLRFSIDEIKEASSIENRAEVGIASLQLTTDMTDQRCINWVAS